MKIIRGYLLARLAVHVEEFVAYFKINLCCCLILIKNSKLGELNLRRLPVLLYTLQHVRWVCLIVLDRLRRSIKTMFWP